MIETYEQAVSYLDGHIGEGIRPGLSRTADVLALMGDPQRDYRVVLVTGSNGKTSTTRIMSSLLTAHGLRVGSFTSPHLEKVEERFSLDNEPAEVEAFVQAVADVSAFADLYEDRSGERLTYFELTTVIAYAFFAAQAVDVAVVEVGMGGRLDATNVADAELAVITGIALEHTDVLGDTLTAIATEKVGITRPGAILVEGPLPTEARAVTIAHCEEHNIERIVFDVDVTLGEFSAAVGGWLVTIEGVHGTYPDVYLPLYGDHQLVNLSVAVAAVEALFGRALAEDAVEEGAALVTVPGRLEAVSAEPLIVIDGAHNPQGMEAAVAGVEEAFGDRDWTVIFGVMGDKEIEAMLPSIASIASRVITTAVHSERAADPVSLAAQIRLTAKCPVDSTPTVGEALELARREMLDTDAVLVVGSLYLAGEVRSILV